MLADLRPTCAPDAPRLADGQAAVVSYSLAGLAKRSGVSIYRIRHYVQGGIVPPARRAGSAAVYDEDHVERLAVIERLRANRVRVPEIRQHVRTLSAQQLRVLAGLEGERAEAPPGVGTKGASGPRALRDAVDALLCVAAEVLDVSPKVLRPAFDAVFTRMSESELTAADVVAVLRGE
jgi:hypothetical protein